MSTNTERISIRAFAKLMDCSHTAVRKAIESGKIVKGWNGSKIDPEIAAQEWAANSAGSVQNPKLKDNLNRGKALPAEPAAAPGSAMSLQEAVRREKAALRSG